MKINIRKLIKEEVNNIVNGYLTFKSKQGKIIDFSQIDKDGDIEVSLDDGDHMVYFYLSKQQALEVVKFISNQYKGV